ncbi:DUF1648 domain-containing protein [Arthrobacter rhombi]|uniref:DUF1648 domain-containing protein n=1 Tax=Arthrobacter rhombi TaxID=71253 RepID=UPI0031D28AD5
MGTITEKELTRGRGPLWLAYPLAAVILLGTQVYGLSLYADLPDPVPTHWGPSGAPDAFDAKSPAAVFGMLWVGLGMTLLMALLTAVVPALSPARAEPSPYRRIQREGMIRGTMGCLGATTVLLAALFSVLAIEGWLRPANVGGWFGVFFTGVILLVIGWASSRGSRWARRRAFEAGVHPDADEATEERLWLWGGMLYNNPADPQIMVAKREGTGTGLAVNVGSTGGKWAVAIFLLLVIGAPLGIFVATTLGAG